MVFRRLPREPRDDIGPQAQNRDAPGNLESPATIGIPSVPTTHASQYRVGPALQGHVEMGSQPATGSLQEVQKKAVHLRGLHASQTKADVGHLLQEKGHQPSQGDGAVQVLAVVADVDSREDQLRVAEAQKPGFSHHLVRRS
jgi:hypothetical protein